jgi:hypothetical protein
MPHRCYYNGYYVMKMIMMSNLKFKSSQGKSSVCALSLSFVAHIQLMELMDS